VAAASTATSGVAAPSRTARPALTSGLRPAIALCSVYILLSGTLALLQHVTYHTRARDMGIYAQILWNAGQGRGLSTTLLMENTNHLAEHFTPVLWPLALLYALIPSPVMLVIVQQLFLGASGIPVYLWARRVLDHTALALLVLASYLAMPALSRIALSEFHPVVMAALPAAVAAYGAFTGQARVTLAGVAVCLLFEEETAFVIAGLGLSWVVMHRSRWRFGAGLFALATVWAVLVALVIMPLFQHRVSREAGNRATGHYADLIEDPPGTIARYAVERTADVGEWLLLPNAGLSLLAPSQLLAAVPTTVVLFLQDRADSYGGHWAGAMVPIIGMATAGGLAVLRRRSDTLGRAGAVALGIVGITTYVLHSHFPGGGDFDPEKYLMTQTEVDMAAAVRLVPSQARVTASRRIVPHLANRPDVWQFPPTLYSAGLRPDTNRQDAYVFDLTDSPTRRILEDLESDSALIRRPRMHVRQFGGSVLLLTREQITPTVPMEITFPGVAVLRGFDLEQVSGELRVTAYWDPVGRSQRDLFRVLRVLDGNGALLGEQVIVPLQTVLPPTRWERGQIVAEQGYVPLSADQARNARIELGWRQTANGPGFPGESGAELVEIYR
jgi:uncharacterized membrane protein